MLTDQLQTALNTRVIIEQAKGVLAARSTRSPEEAFAARRSYACAQRLRLSDLANDVVCGAIDVQTVVAHQARTQ